MASGGDKNTTTIIQQQESLWTLSRHALDWLLGQQGNTIALFVILGVIGYLGYYAINTAIPAHLTQIQDGYERIEKSQTQQIEAITKQHSHDVEIITSNFEKHEKQSNDLLRDFLDMHRKTTPAGATSPN